MTKEETEKNKKERDSEIEGGCSVPSLVWENIDGLPMFEITYMGALVRQRALTASSGINIWFHF